MAQTHRQFMFNGDLFEHNTSLSGKETYLRNGYLINETYYNEYLAKYREAFAVRYQAPLPSVEDFPRRYRR